MKTLKETKLAKTLLRLVDTGKTFVGVAVVDGAVKLQVEGATADEAWRRLHDEVSKVNPNYVGFDGARNRFLRFFPGGFHSSEYEEKERGYKVAAKAKLDREAPVERAVTGHGFGEAILSVFRATNLLSLYEKTRLQEVLRGPGADRFVQAAARFALGETTPALLDMERALKPHENAKWTVVTYLPFLWRPETHMFLKPEATKDFAVRVGHRFASDYEPRLAMPVYQSLLDLASTTAAELTELMPRDRIDVQSFIWVVGAYEDGKELPIP